MTLGDSLAEADVMSHLICTQCGTAGRPQTKTQGSLIVELFLWVCFIVPGVLYSLWRLTTRAKCCRACGSTNLVPLDSPVGRNLQRSVR